jgi:hypothetical protein
MVGSGLKDFASEELRFRRFARNQAYYAAASATGTTAAAL